MHRPVDKPVDNLRLVRIMARILWISCGRKKTRMNYPGPLARQPARAIEMHSPQETDTIRGQLRGRERNRATGVYRGCLALADGPRRRKDRATGRPWCGKGRARPLHLIHGGALSLFGPRRATIQRRFPTIVSIQAASAVLLLVALRDSREAGSGDLWKRRHPGVSGECVAERGLSTRNPTTSTLSSLHGIPTSPGVSGVIVRGVRPSCRRASSSGAAFGRRRACERGRRRRRSWR